MNFSVAASVLSISQIAGCLLCGVVLDEFGRRMTLILLSVPFVIGWVIQCAVPQTLNVELLFIGRVITGVACGLACAPAVVYIGETATKEYRSMLVTWPTVGVSGGILLVYLLGWGIQEDWRLVAGITIALPVIASLLAFFYLKETPNWLLSQGRVEEAEVSFRWIREVSQNEAMPDKVREEFEDLVDSYKRRTSAQKEDPHISTISNAIDGKPTLNNVKHESRFRQVWQRIASLKNPEVWKPLVINNMCFFFMQFGGIQVVAAYAVDIMESAGVSIDPYVAAVLLGGVHFLSGMGASFANSRYEYLCPSVSLLFFFSFSQFLITAPTYFRIIMASFTLIISFYCISYI
jgi:MFS family permease